MPKSNFFSFQDIIMSVTGILIVVALMLALQIDRVVTASPAKGISTDAEPAATRRAELDEMEMTVAGLKEKLELLHGAARKTESESEIKAQIARMEERVLGLSSRNPVKNDSAMSLADFAEIKTKAAEILRVREEIRQCEEAVSRFTESAAEASLRMQDLEMKVKQSEAAVIAARVKSRGLRLIRELSDTTKEPIIVDVGGKSLKIMRFDKPGLIEAVSLKDFYQLIRSFKKQDQYFVLYFRPDGAGRFEELRQAVKNSGFEVGYDAIPQDAEIALGKEDDP